MAERGERKNRKKKAPVDWYLLTEPQDAQGKTLHAAALTDEQALLVYADWLVERGDPLGELIQVLASKREDLQARASELIRANKKTWANAIRRQVEAEVLSIFRDAYAMSEKQMSDAQALAFDPNEWDVDPAMFIETVCDRFGVEMADYSTLGELVEHVVRHWDGLTLSSHFA